MPNLTIRPVSLGSLGSLGALGDPSAIVLSYDLEDDFGLQDVQNFAIDLGVNRNQAQQVATRAATNTAALMDRASSRSFWRGLLLGGAVALGTVIAVKAVRKTRLEADLAG